MIMRSGADFGGKNGANTLKNNLIKCVHLKCARDSAKEKIGRGGASLIKRYGRPQRISRARRRQTARMLSSTSLDMAKSATSVGRSSAAPSSAHGATRSHNEPLINAPAIAQIDWLILRSRVTSTTTRLASVYVHKQINQHALNTSHQFTALDWHFVCIQFVICMARIDLKLA
jgi:hypothetical protein